MKGTGLTKDKIKRTWAWKKNHIGLSYEHLHPHVMRY